MSKQGYFMTIIVLYVWHNLGVSFHALSIVFEVCVCVCFVGRC